MSVPHISAAEAARLFDAGEATPLDVRQPDEYANGHIAGATLLPLGDIPAKAAELLPDKSAPLVLYCRSGARSDMAAKQLESMGYTNLRNMGGVMYWPYELDYS